MRHCIQKWPNIYIFPITFAPVGALTHPDQSPKEAQSGAVMAFILALSATVVTAYGPARATARKEG
ncbi:hypothetical protein ACSL103130_02115 [Actinomyces slackii]|uniref:Uncharacterized protein n=1 Tax=Actinomyces slackii TaxID=52774 RepID=A0A3S4SU59_9ACTO|nr:Uncharacterised protein [Actinomyces slackii]